MENCNHDYWHTQQPALQSAKFLAVGSMLKWNTDPQPLPFPLHIPVVSTSPPSPSLLNSPPDDWRNLLLSEQTVPSLLESSVKKEQK